MTDIKDATDVTAEDLAAWFKMQDDLRKLKASEAMLRSRIYKQYFPDAVEGTNNHELEDGTGAVLKGKRVVSRKILEPELDAYKTACKEEGSNLPKLPWNKLVKYDPQLVKAEYNKLTDEERDACDQVLLIKDGQPGLEIVIPKKKGGKGA